MLQKFLEKNRKEILSLSEEKILAFAGQRSSSEELRKALPLFYDHLISYLKSSCDAPPTEDIKKDAVGHGKELLRLHYTLSQVVQSYGAMCQAITGLAQKIDADISSQDFNQLNLCLDVAIAAAVSEFQYRNVQASEKREVEHLGFLVHELRNSLSSATIAADMIAQGLVGSNGSTGNILQMNLRRMRDLIDRSLSEVRMRADSEVNIEIFQLSALVDQVLYTAQSEAREKKQILTNEIKSGIELSTDRQLLLSTIANLTQNALKYTKVGGRILWRANFDRDAKNIIFEIEDECCGLAPEVEKNLFSPFKSGGVDQTGLGLGLTIVQRAVLLLKGTISVRNLPGKGCIFILSIPKTIKRPEVT